MQREAGQTLAVVGGQLAGSLPHGATAAKSVVAYEPVWAIGTGLTPTSEDVADVHAFIRHELVDLLPDDGAKVRILYGGSVKPSNARELMGVANVNGALVGGASLTAKDFLGIAGFTSKTAAFGVPTASFALRPAHLAAAAFSRRLLRFIKIPQHAFAAGYRGFPRSALRTEICRRF